MTPMLRFEAPPKFTKNLLIALLSLYIVELLVVQWFAIPLNRILPWDPSSGLSQPWTPLTMFLYQDPRPLSFLFDLLALYFFMPTFQRKYGVTSAYSLLTGVFLVSLIFGTLGLYSGAIPMTGPSVLGLGAYVLALVVIFGLNNPNATILLLFFPIQAAWIAWGSGILTGLNFLATRSLDSAVLLSGWIAGYLFIQKRRYGSFNKWFKKMQHNQQKNRSRKHLEVIKGGRSKKDTIH